MDGSMFRDLPRMFAILLISLFLVGGGCGFIVAKLSDHLPSIKVTFEEKKP